MTFSNVYDLRQETYRAKSWRIIELDQPRPKRLQQLTVEQVLEDVRGDYELEALGQRLRMLGITYYAIAKLIEGLLDAKNRAKGTRVDLDGAEIDWEAAWCFRDEENRKDEDRNGRAPHDCYSKPERARTLEGEAP